VRYDTNIMLSPADLTSRQDDALGRTGVYSAVTAQLRKLGYRGKWHQRAGSRFGLFSKRLRDLGALREEVGHLSNVSLKGLVAEAGRRTTR
jgi:hypothetical protein